MRTRIAALAIAILFVLPIAGTLRRTESEYASTNAAPLCPAAFGNRAARRAADFAELRVRHPRRTGKRTDSV